MADDPVEDPVLAYDAALTAYALDVPRREAIPSARQLANGAVTPAGGPPPPPPREVKPGKRAYARRLGRLLDPRDIAGSTTIVPLVVLTLLQTVGNFDNSAFGFLLVFIKADLGFDFQYLFTISSIVGVITVLAAPLMGYLADRVKRVWMVRVGSLIDNTSTILAGLAGSPAMLTGSQVIGGFGPAISGPALLPLLADYYPVEKRARVIGFQQMVNVVWLALSNGVLIVSFIFFGVSWRFILIGTGILATITSLASFLIKEPVRGAVDRMSMGIDAEAALEEQKPATWSEAWRTASSIATLRRIWYATPFIDASLRGLFTFLFFAQQRKLALSGTTDGLLANPRFQQLLPVLSIGLPAVVGMILTPFATDYAQKVLARRPGRILYAAGVGLLLQGLTVGLILLLPVALYPVVLLFQFGIGALNGLIVPARSLVLTVVVPSRIRAQGLQTATFFSLPGFAILLVLGALADTYGATTAAYLTMPVLFVGSAILMASGGSVARDIRSALASAAADQESRDARTRGAAKLLVCRDVDVTFDGTQVLFGVDLDIGEGEIVALLGTNGAGKSTVLRAVVGIHQASNGAIFLDGEDVTHRPPHLNAQHGVVFLPGGHAIFPTLTVEENLRAASWLRKDDDDEDLLARTEEVLDLFPVLRERMSTMAGDMSGGEQQMLALSQAFLMRPRLLMIDELSLGLAPSVVSRLLDVVRAINESGTTVVLVEQSVNVALTIAPRAVFMEKGTIRFDGPTSELLERTDLLRAVFLGGTAGALAGLTRRRRPGADTEAALSVVGASLAYGGVRALEHVDLQVGAGEVVGVIGPNGAGKTTLFDVISGFAVPDAGTVLLGGVDVTALAPDARGRMGLARSFQQARLFPSLTVRETIAVALERRLAARSAVLAAVWSPTVRRSERRAFRRVDNLIEVLGLGDYANKFVNELSTGSRRMVDLACTMAAEPSVLLLDEPSSGMAQAEIEVLGPVIQRLAVDTGCGVLVVEHDLPLVTEMSDRLVAMELGSTIATGPPDEVLNDPRVIASYLSASGAAIQRSGNVLHTALARLGLAADARP